MTKIATSIHTGSAAEAPAALANAVRKQLEGRAPVLVVAFTSTKQPLAEVLPQLSREFPGAVVIGASTAGEFTESGDKKSAASVFALAGDYVVKTGFGVGLRAGPEVAIEQALAAVPREVEGYPHCTAILLLDPLSGNSEEATLVAGAMLGPDVRIAGGAAGDDLKMERTYVGAGSRVASDAVSLTLIFSKSPLGMGVSHGHRPLELAPVRVTRSDGGVVHELDGKPAWDVWRDLTRAAAKRQGIDVDAIPPGEEGGYLLRFEGGLAAGADTFKIRAPLARSGATSIQFACGVPVGSVLHITESTGPAQVESARHAARLALQALGGRRAAGALVFDCICRNLILADAFGDAVRGMAEELGGVPLAGFETYGEIALDSGDMSGFHNTSSVVLAFPA